MALPLRAGQGKADLTWKVVQPDSQGLSQPLAWSVLLMGRSRRATEGVAVGFANYGAGVICDFQFCFVWPHSFKLEYF